MTGLPCVEECKAEGGLCTPLTEDEVGRPGDMSRSEVQTYIADHRKNAHRSYIVGALWSCAEGHQKEASGVEVMEHAGTPRLT